MHQALALFTSVESTTIFKIKLDFITVYLKGWSFLKVITTLLGALIPIMLWCTVVIKINIDKNIS